MNTITQTLITDEMRQERSQKITLVLAFAAIYIIWGSTYYAMRIVITTIPMFIMAAFRFLLAFGIMMVWAKLGKHAHPSKEEMKRALISGIFLLVSGNAGVLVANRFLNSSGIIAVLIAITPFWVVLLQWLLYKTKPTLSVIIGLAIGLIGMATLMGPKNLQNLGENAWIGILAAVLSTFGWSVGTLYSYAGKMPSSPAYSSGLQMLAASIIMFTASLFTGEWEQFDVNAIDMKSMLSFWYLVICGSVLGFTAYTYVSRNASPSSATTYAYVNPVIALFIGWWLGNEVINQQTLIAATLLIGAVALVVAKPKLG